MRDTQSRQEGDLFTTINAPLHCLCHLSLFLLLSEEPLLCFLIRHQVQHSRSSSSGVTQTSVPLGSPISAIKTHLFLLWGLLRACFRDEYYSYIKEKIFFLSIHLLMNMWVVCSFGSIKNRASMSNYLLISSGHKFHFPFCFGQMSRDGKAGPFSQCVFNFLRNWSSLWASHLAFSLPVRESSSPIRNILN